MVDLEFGPEAARAETPLQHAAGIGCHDRFSTGRGRGPHFFFEQSLGHGGVSQVVNTRAAAATVGAFHLDELQAGNRLKQMARVAANSLAMREMTRVLISNRHFQPAKLADQSKMMSPPPALPRSICAPGGAIGSRPGFAKHEIPSIRLLAGHPASVSNAE